MHCVNRYDTYWNGDGSVTSVKLCEGGSIAKVGKTDFFPFVFSADVCTFFTFVWTPEMSSYRHRPRPNRAERRGQNMGHCGPIIGWSDTITSEWICWHNPFTQHISMVSVSPHPEEGQLPVETLLVSACCFYILYEASTMCWVSSLMWLTSDKLCVTCTESKAMHFWTHNFKELLGWKSHFWPCFNVSQYLYYEPNKQSVWWLRISAFLLQSLLTVSKNGFRKNWSSTLET